MALRFRKAVRLAPGLRINLAKRGLSLSVGRHGLTENFGRRGARTTVGLPGTGLSYSTRRRRPSGSLVGVLALVAIVVLVVIAIG